MIQTKLTKLTFSINIKSNQKKVWDTMLGLETYKIWTKAFDSTSYYQGSWEMGQTIEFMDKNKSGMLGKIRESDYPKFIAIEYIGWLKKGELDLVTVGAKETVGAIESYSFMKISDNETLLHIDLDTMVEFAGYMTKAWKAALKKLKKLCEEEVSPVI